MTSLRIAVPVLLAGLGALVLPASASTPVGSSAPVNGSATEFDAPMFNTTATLTGNRLPEVADITCADAACTTGIIPNPAGGSIVFITKDYARGGAFADNPGFVAKLAQFWDNTSQSGGNNYSEFGVNLAEFTPGTDLAAAIVANAQSLGGTPVAQESIGPINIWTLETTFLDLKWTIAYVAKGDTIARSTCIQSGTDIGSTSCPLANVQKAGIDVVNKDAGSILRGSRGVRNLIPVTPRGLVPFVMNIESTRAMWGNTFPSPALKKSLTANKNSISLDYLLKLAPTLSFSVNVAALNNESAARQFVKDVCKSTADPKSACKRTRLAGPAYGYVGVWSQDDDSTKAASVVSQFVGERRLVEVNCFPVGGTVDKPMTTKEIKACTTGIVKVSAAIMGE